MTFMVPASNRLNFSSVEKKKRLEYIHIFDHLINGKIIRDKLSLSGKLNARYYYKLCTRVELVGHYLTKAVPLQMTLVFGPCFLFLSILTYYIPNADQSWTFFVWTAIYTIFFWYAMIGEFTVYAIFYITVTYLMYRFRQVKETMEKIIIENSKHLIAHPDSRIWKNLILAIEEHEEICQINTRNNILMNKIMAILYFVNSPLLDVIIYQLIYVDSIWIIKYSLLCVGIVTIILLYVLTFQSARMSLAAHSPYKIIFALLAKEASQHIQTEASSYSRVPDFSRQHLVSRSSSSLIASTSIPLKHRLKLAHFLEKLAGPSIAVYCSNLFPLNNFEFYNFFIAVIYNFFLLISLFLRSEFKL